MSEYADLSDALYGYPLDRVRVLDAETTGLSPETDEILSLAIVDGNGNKLLSTYLKPIAHQSWPEAEAVNSITWNMVRDSPRLTDLWEEIKALLDRDDVLIVGYNVRFDLRFLVYGGVGLLNDLHVLDVMDLYKEIKGPGQSRLVDCARHYGYEFDAHGALADARATAFCFRQINRDPKYFTPLLERSSSKTITWTFSQTKATTEAARQVLGKASSATYDGKLITGQVTRGKSKGATRYECVVDGQVVGNGSPSMVGIVRERLGLDEGQDVPTLSARVSLSLQGNGTVFCNAEVEVASTYWETVHNLARSSSGAAEEIEAMRRQELVERSEVMNSPTEADLKTEKKSFFKRLFGL